MDRLRTFAVARSLFPPITLKRALDKLGFVQADPIRAPARAQDLILRHRVKGYRAGDLEQRFGTLGVEEDFFVVYGFVTQQIQQLMHPRPDALVPAEGSVKWPRKTKELAKLLLDFVTERGVVHPREVDRHFARGQVKNYWGGSSNETTHLLNMMHYRGMLRVVGRDRGIRMYAVHNHGPEAADVAERHARIDALVDAAVHVYAPLHLGGLRYVVNRLRYAAPQWRGELKEALARAKQRLAHQHVDGVDWYWPAGEKIGRSAAPEMVRLLTPFDPVVWDRDRFELFWGWVYRFEAYTPAPKRKLGYYALPMLWRDRVIGWGNLSVDNGKLKTEFGYVAGAPPHEANFRRELEAELDRIRVFLGLDAVTQ